MLLLISVLCLSLLFVVSAIGKINNFSATVNSLKSVFWIKKLPNWFYQLSIMGVIVLLIGAPIILVCAVLNPMYSIFAKLACYALILFTILATLLYHYPTDPSQRNDFMKNVSIIGGFLALSMHF